MMYRHCERERYKRRKYHEREPDGGFDDFLEDLSERKKVNIFPKIKQIEVY